MSFGNMAFIVYILLSAAATAGLFAAHLLWKRRVLASMMRSGEMRNRMVRTSPARAAVKAALVILAIVVSALALLRPQWGETAREVTSEGTDVLMALDVSRSMLARDVEPSRLDRAKDALRLIAGSLRGDRAGLILFAGDAFLQCPLTADMGAFTMFIDSAGTDSVRLQGTDLGAALETAAKVFEKKRLTSKLLIVITDGEDHEGGALGGAGKLRDLGVSVYAVGVGTRSGGEIPVAGDTKSGSARDGEGRTIVTKKNMSLLDRIARETGGETLDITGSLSDVYKILGTISEQEKTGRGTRIVKEKTERYQVFALLLLAILALEMTVPGRRRRE